MTSPRSALSTLAVTALFSFLTSTAPATVLYWYPNAAPNQGGSGTWDTTTSRWSTTSGATKTTPVSAPGASDDVIFGGTAGTVIVTTSTANLIQIETSGYVFLAGGVTTTRSITFGGFSGSALASTVIKGADSHSKRGVTLNATADTTFSGTIIDGANLGFDIRKQGSGSLTLTGNNSYTGFTQIEQGALIVNGNQTSATGAVTVTNATLGGEGIIGGTTTIGTGGILTPGSTNGTLTFNQDLIVNTTTSTVVFEGGDHVNVVGQLTLSSEWNLTLSAGFADGGSIVLFTFGTISGSPDLTPDFDISGLGFTPSSTLTLSQVGNSIVLNGISVIPEPSTGLLVLLGIGAAGLLRKRVRSVPYGFRISR